MKVLNLVLLVVLLSGGVIAQSSSPDAPDVKVLENSWRRKVGKVKSADDPLGPSTNRIKEQQDLRVAGGDEGHIRRIYSSPAPRPRLDSVNQTTRVVQRIYKATLINTGAKKIKRLVWEYVFYDKTSGREVDYYHFTSQVNIRPGQTVKVVEIETDYSPGASDATRNSGDLEEGRVIIRSIQYDDGSVWSTPAK